MTNNTALDQKKNLMREGGEKKLDFDTISGK